MKTTHSGEWLQKRLIRNAVITGLILLIPLIAMQFSKEIDWGFGDFAVIGALVFGTSVLYELGARELSQPSHRIFLGVILLGVVCMIWAELAVDLISKLVSGEFLVWD